MKKIVELKLNKWLINRLGIHDKTKVGIPISISSAQARWIAIQWIDDVEYELGYDLGKELGAQIKRFCVDHWENVRKHSPDYSEAKEKLKSLLDAEFNHLYLDKSSERMHESLNDEQFIKHLQNGLGYARGNRNAESQQIARDWIESAELELENLFSPGHVFRIERFIEREWPVMLERFHGDKRLALISINNVLDAKYNELR